MTDKHGTIFPAASRSHDLPYWLVLNRVKGFGPRRFAMLRQQEPGLSNWFSGTLPRPEFNQWCQQHGLPSLSLDWQGVERDLDWIKQEGCHIVTLADERYPFQLKEIAAAPPVLFIKGEPACLQQPQLAIVGSRHPTAAGREHAFQFGLELAQAGFVVTSGMALGIDTASHQGALVAGAKTIAVLGCGLDRTYPSQNKALAGSIAQAGALVTEFPIGAPPLAAHFPQRNRIISGLALGVIVIEAALKSGSLMTANYALEQGREVFALPGSISNPVAKGCHHLIRQGAKCIESIAHVLEELPPIAAASATNRFEAAGNTAKEITALSLEEKNLLAHVEDVCTPVDVVVARSGLTASAVCSMLLDMELQGWVASVPGGYVRVIGEKRI